VSPEIILLDKILKKIYLLNHIYEFFKYLYISACYLFSLNNISDKTFRYFYSKIKDEFPFGAYSQQNFKLCITAGRLHSINIKAYTAKESNHEEIDVKTETAYDYPVLEADVLVIGGGSAGSMAAIRAKEVNPDQTVVVFEKSDFKYSGCIARGMDALNIVAIPGKEDPQLYVESNGIACQGIMDESPSYVMAERSWEMMQKLIDLGVYFPQDENGEYERLQVHPKGRFCITMKEPELKVILANRALELGTKVINRTTTVRLLKDGDRVCGAIGMDVRSGEMIICKAKSVILSAGGTARFGLPENGYLYSGYDFPGNTGDGYILAYRAGAKLSGFEYTLIYYIIKDINAPLLYITLTRGAHLLNAFGETFHEDHPGVLLMHDEHQANRGPMRIKMDHLSEEKIKEIEDLLFTTERPVQERFFKGRGVDFRSGEIELWPTDCYLCGGHGLTGVMVNDRAEASVPGLYAAGDTSLVARGHLSGALVFGMIAAENATEYARSAPEPKINQDQVEAFISDREEKLSQKENPVSVEEFEFKVRRTINDYIKPPKNGHKLDRALWWMDRFRHEARTMVRVDNIHDLFKLYEVENIIQSAHMSAIASKTRTESRWGIWHHRSDYPERNDDQWMKHIVLTMGDRLEDIRVSYQEIEKMESS
jgi:succinate dehydrogenase/fumarate reductase flavoprotein subunit